MPRVVIAGYEKTFGSSSSLSCLQVLVAASVSMIFQLLAEIVFGDVRLTQPIRDAMAAGSDLRVSMDWMDRGASSVMGLNLG